MTKQISCFSCLSIAILAIVQLSHAQQPGKILRIGFLDNSTASGSAVLVDAFRQEMSKLGWIEGKNIAIEYRFAEQKAERLPELAADLVRLKVDLIVVTGDSGRRWRRREQLATIPIVMTNVGDPVGFRFGCQSGAAGRQRHRGLEFRDRAKHQKARDTQGRSPQARPSWTSPDCAGASGATRRPIERAQGCGCRTEAKLEEIETQPDAKGLESAFQTAKQKQVSAIMMITPLAAFSPKESGSSSLRTNIGCRRFTSQKEFVDEGGLMSYGADYVTSIGGWLFTWTKS